MSGRNLQDYIEVKDRIAEFWKRHPEGRVLTRVVEYSAERVLLFAEVYTDREDARPAATGYAEEVRSDRGVNATSAVENGETSAIGRALANLGMTLSKNRASREEMQKVERMEHSRAGAEVAPSPAQHAARPSPAPRAPAETTPAGAPPPRDGGGRVITPCPECPHPRTCQHTEGYCFLHENGDPAAVSAARAEQRAKLAAAGPPSQMTAEEKAEAAREFFGRVRTGQGALHMGERLIAEGVPPKLWTAEFYRACDRLGVQPEERAGVNAKLNDVAAVTA